MTSTSPTDQPSVQPSDQPADLTADHPSDLASPAGAADIVTALLDIHAWVAHDIDETGRVLAGSDELGSLQLVEIAPDGTRTPLTALPGRCTGRYVPGRREVIVEHDAGGDEKWQISLLDLSRPRTAPASPSDLTPIVHDPAHLNVVHDVRADALVYSTNRRNEVDMDVVVRDLGTGDASETTGAERVVFDRGGYVADTTLSHDGRRVAVTELSLQPASTVVSVAGPAGSEDVTDRHEHAAHEVAGWSADDAALVLSTNHDRDVAAVVEVALDGGDLVAPDGGDLVAPDGGDLDGSRWRTLIEADDHDLLARLSPDGDAMLVLHRVDGLDTLAVHEADGSHRVDVDLEPAAVSGIRWAADGSRIVVTFSRPTDPGSIVAVDAHTGVATTVVDGRAGVPGWLRDRLVEPTVHRVPTPDGERVPCFRYAAEPAGPHAPAPAAAVIHIHGGPESEARRMFSPVLQALALSGFDVLVPNVRGSDGYGKRWVSLDDVDRRLDSVADLAAIHEWLPSLGLDPRRAALWGGSYGGYMVLAGVAMQPDLWAAGVDIVGMSSLVTFLEHTSDYRRAYREREYGSLERDRELLEKASPITYLDDIVAPLFVIHGANDPRVPLSEAEQIKAALDGRGIDCELRVYGDEGHGLSKRANRLDAYPAAIDFLRGHLS